MKYGQAMAAAMGGRHRRCAHHSRRRSDPSAPRCTPSPTPSPPTGSPPTPSATATACASSPTHCPFGGAALEHPVICAVDRGLVRGMLGALYGDADAATSASLPMGDDRCITDLSHSEVSHSEAELPRRGASHSEAELPRRP